MAPPYLSELKQAGGHRTFDYDDAAAAAAIKILAGKTAVTSHTVATTSATPQVAATSHQTGAMLINGWQESAIDLTKTGAEISTTSGNGTGVVDTPEVGSNVASSHKPPLSTAAPLTSCMGIDMAGILQAGLIHPVTGQIVNGSLRGDDSLKRRRGRRRNMEALYSVFTKSRGLHIPETQVRRRRRVCQVPEQLKLLYVYISVKRGNHSKGITV